MILEEFFNEKEGTEEVWYDSSMIKYSLYNSNTKKLTIIYNNNTIYDYLDVEITPSYVMFKHGGLDSSQGKALNRYIKPNFKCEKNNYLTNDPDSYMEERRKNKSISDMKESTYFISGHRNLTEEEFIKNYAPVLKKLAESKCYFVVGDYNGCDIMAQDYLMDEIGISEERIKVYHMGETPNKINKKITNTVGWFSSDEERDAKMTDDSFDDVAFVRDNLELSGTAMNILRRKKLHN